MGRRGPLPKTPAQKARDGSKKRPPAAPPVAFPAASAEPPAVLVGKAMAETRAIWNTIAPGLIAAGVLATVDVHELATACQLQAMGNNMARGAGGKAGKAFYGALKCWERASKIFQRFGISDRTRLGVSGAAPDEFETFVGQRR